MWSKHANHCEIRLNLLASRRKYPEEGMRLDTLAFLMLAAHCLTPSNSGNNLHDAENRLSENE